MPVNFKLSLIVLSCLFDIAGWKEENWKFLSKYCTFDENKLSIRVKSIDRWVLDALRREKEMEKVLHANDLALRKSEICSISRREIFNIKSRKKIHLPR